VAAYNCGPGNVDKAIRRSGSRDFWKLQYYLPTESMNHVKKFISTHYVFEGEGGITTVTKDETKDLIMQKISNLTEEEMKEFQQRLDIAVRLHYKTPYTEIEKELGVSSTTIARVSKYLK